MLISCEIYADFSCRKAFKGDEKRVGIASHAVNMFKTMMIVRIRRSPRRVKVGKGEELLLTISLVNVCRNVI